MNQNQSEGYAAKVKVKSWRPFTAHSISTSPDINAMPGNAWNSAAGIARNDGGQLADYAKHASKIHTVHIYHNRFNHMSDMLYILLWTCLTCPIWKIQYLIKMQGWKTTYFIKPPYYIHIWRKTDNIKNDVFLNIS